MSSSSIQPGLSRKARTVSTQPYNFDGHGLYMNNNLQVSWNLPSELTLLGNLRRYVIFSSA